ncbi:hypothetical protein ST37_01065 (plasmid) [Vibrio sp. qd031]|uniref:hypothetical protein n=1 Tax=Vibrio sp. qd031 TaxID=1603038 RepID=UPI000A101791|nr:hypothetical protein [Vibrio sp. qd031]ORT52415.1 hypothetical protein ST37_01065 [Vibrio sp. qd031]
MKNLLLVEWQTLHGQYHDYDKLSQWIKLSATVLFVIMYLMEGHWVITIGLVGLLWLQEAMLKTFQSRIESRLLVVEQMVESESDDLSSPLQLHSEFSKRRPSFSGLIKDNLKQSLRPTVAIFYLVLISLTVLSMLLQ